MNSNIDKSVLSVKQLLLLENVGIPEYQRPYKWTQKNVVQLLQDLQRHCDKSAYRLGSIVFHQRSQNEISLLDIVDGQQRSLTLILVVWALIEGRMSGLSRQDLKDSLNQLRPAITSFMARQRFSSVISQHNLHQNYLELKRQVGRPTFTESHIDFLLNKCQVVVFSLADVSEAFQFFDSQNARGRDLAPHDLLKAFHLREFADHESSLKAISVAHWEGLNSDELAILFATYLYRIRQWAKGQSARYFGKEDVDLFKGVNLDSIAHFPYVESLRITHHFVDDFNAQYQRKIDRQRMKFPFHLDQMIINGRRFFEMAEHFQQQVARIVSNKKQTQSGNGNQNSPNWMANLEPNGKACEIIHTLNTYKARTRTGDQYVRSMFDCAVIFYQDKFGTLGLSSAIEKIFIWAYTCRIQYQVVQLATMDNHVLKSNLFRNIKEAILPADVLSFPLETLKATDNKNNRREADIQQDPLVNLFKSMNYYE